jgi:hypothetical protein
MLTNLTIFHGNLHSTVHWWDDTGTHVFSVDLDESGQLDSTFYKQKSEFSRPKSYDLNAPRCAKIKEALLEFLGDGAVWRQGRAQLER